MANTIMHLVMQYRQCACEFESYSVVASVSYRTPEARALAAAELMSGSDSRRGSAEGFSGGSGIDGLGRRLHKCNSTV